MEIKREMNINNFTCAFGICDEVTWHSEAMEPTHSAPNLNLNGRPVRLKFVENAEAKCKLSVTNMPFRLSVGCSIYPSQSCFLSFLFPARPFCIFSLVTTSLNIQLILCFLVNRCVNAFKKHFYKMLANGIKGLLRMPRNSIGVNLNKAGYVTRQSRTAKQAQ